MRPDPGTVMGEPQAAAGGILDPRLPRIEHFVVLMLENRSFDHLMGSLKSLDARVDGALAREFSNRADPADPGSPAIATGPADRYAMLFDPGHEFIDVQIQLYGRAAGAPRAPAARTDPAPMNGFVGSATATAATAVDAACVMQCFQPEQLTVLSALARQYAIFNYWHSSMPGPTWPNRFFVHAATSGGLSDSPSLDATLLGYEFSAGTIFDRLDGRRLGWRIYHTGLPQTAGIDSLRLQYLDPFTDRFRSIDSLADDLQQAAFPEYAFVEPYYDTGNNYAGGDSMHPLNDVRKGEALVKRVYEALRNSPIWSKAMLIVTFDEHGGFFDHVAPPAAVPSADERRYANEANAFGFDRLGVRVPTIVVSPYTARGTVIGTQAKVDAYDHTCIPATLERRFGLDPLTARDRAARSLEAAINLDQPRLSADEAPLRLPDPAADSLLTRIGRFLRAQRQPSVTALSKGQEAQLFLAHACNLRVLDPSQVGPAKARFDSIRHDPAQAAQYLNEVEGRISGRRHAPGAKVRR